MSSPVKFTAMSKLRQKNQIESESRTTIKRSSHRARRQVRMAIRTPPATAIMVLVPASAFVAPPTIMFFKIVLCHPMMTMMAVAGGVLLAILTCLLALWKLLFMVVLESDSIWFWHGSEFSWRWYLLALTWVSLNAACICRYRIYLSDTPGLLSYFCIISASLPTDTAEDRHFHSAVLNLLVLMIILNAN